MNHHVLFYRVPEIDKVRVGRSSARVQRIWNRLAHLHQSRPLSLVVVSDVRKSLRPTKSHFIRAVVKQYAYSRVCTPQQENVYIELEVDAKIAVELEPVAQRRIALITAA